MSTKQEVQTAEQVRRWLRDSGAVFVEQKPVKVERAFRTQAGEPEVRGFRWTLHFRVVAPFPAAVQVVEDDDILFRSRRTVIRPDWGRPERFLVPRILIAERFGSSLPLIYVLPGNAEYLDSLGSVPFGDATFRADRLPFYADLPRILKLNADVQSILRKGDPGDPALTGADEIAMAWSRAISPDELGRPEPFPSDSIAESIRTELRDYDQNPTRKRPYSTRQLSLEGERTSRTPLWLVAPHLIDRVLLRQLVGRLGGRSVPIRIPLPGDQQAHELRREGWESDNGYRAVIQRAVYSGVQTGRWIFPSQEIATAWLLRGLSPARLSKLILLLGSRDREGPAPWVVNQFEAAGWTVLPWDFAESEPAFVRSLREDARL
jgi:hypothetical protein